MALREDVIQSAVKFLQDPKVQSSPLARRIAFLESKGLSSEEIEQAMQRASGGTGTTTAVVPAAPGVMQPVGVPGGVQMYPAPGYPAYGPPMQPPPPPPKERDWKDYFIATTIAAGIGYGIYMFAKNYLAPWIQFPAQERLDEDRKHMDEQLSTASTALTAVKDETTSVMKAIDSQATKVNEALSLVETTLKELKEADDKRDEELRSLKDDIENIKNLIPKMIDKGKETQNQVLTDLQTEIKSLKSLLLSRRVGPGGTSVPIGGAGGEGETASAPAALVSAPAAPAAASPALPVPNSLQAKIPSVPSIPSWQLQADAKKEESAGSS
ncbi:microbody biogenesis protein peroxin 14 [Hyaloraphidium curvatum]|nr:microbody biogenesis protein peroxin 14 [Hyaloraphidium curvatum]